MIVTTTHLENNCLHIRRALAMNSEKNMPVRVMNSAGYVQKMPAVEFAPVTVRIPAPPSKVSMADL
jgi:hypothetical protein